jgi:hypothetical protein
MEFEELLFDGWKFGFGDLSQEDQGEVKVFGCGAAAFGEFDGLCKAGEGLG